MKKVTLQKEIYLIEDFLTSGDCQSLIAYSEECGYEEAKVNLDGKQVLMATVRNNERLLDSNSARAEGYWDHLRMFHPRELGNAQAIGLNELFRFYKYTNKQRFKKHRDGSYVRNDQEFSAYTFMIYLNDDYSGGETAFADLTVQPKQGTALIFRHELKHEGKPIIDGIKYVLRSDIMYRLNETDE